MTKPKTKSYFVKYRTKDGKTLVGGILEGQSSRFQAREDAQTRKEQIVEINNDRAEAQIVESPLYPEIFRHCPDSLPQAIGGKCFACKKILDAKDAKKAKPIP